ncbi:MAG: hypothetical protein NVS2B6_07890 [Thermoleophilaceae bacterium]
MGGQGRPAGLADQPPAPTAASPGRGFGRGAGILSVSIGVTGLVTYAYFALASHALSVSAYGGITLLWSAIFITAAVIYRPVEQLLSRTIADRTARGIEGSEHLRVAATIQGGLGALFAVAGLALRDPLQRDLLGGSATLYWVLMAAVVAYAASYFARGFLAGHLRFGLYGGLVLLESVSRCMFALAAVVGIAAGQAVVALGMAAAPIVSLAVVPWALGRSIRRTPTSSEPALVPGGTDPGGASDVPVAARQDPAEKFTVAHGTRFAGAVLVIMLSEQTFLNAGPLLVKASTGARGAALAGFAFNVLLVARAPLQLFQAVQTAILPHLTKLRAGGEGDPFRRSVNLTLLAIAAFAALVAGSLLAVGPAAMRLVFGNKHFEYSRLGLMLVALGMGFYLAAATLNQAALARGLSRQAAICWAIAAIAFVVALLIPGFSDRVLQVEGAYLAGALFLYALLYRLYRRPDR